MRLAQLEHKLLRAAQLDVPSDAVPYAFEQRIMARLAARRAPERWSEWGRQLWRAAAPALGFTLLLGVWTFSASITAEPVSLDSELESAVYAAIETPTDAW